MKNLKISKKPLRNTYERIGIIGPYGNIWTQETFDTKEAAEAHVHNFWHKIGNKKMHLYKYVPVRVIISVI